MDTVQLIRQLQDRRGTDPVVIYDPGTQRYLEIDFVDADPNRVLVQACDSGETENDLLEVFKTLCDVADLSLDYRPEFRRALSNAHSAIAKASLT